MIYVALANTPLYWNWTRTVSSISLSFSLVDCDFFFFTFICHGCSSGNVAYLLKPLDIIFLNLSCKFFLEKKGLQCFILCFCQHSNSLTFVKHGLKFKKRPFKKLKNVRAPHRRPASKNATLNTRISKALHNILELAHFRLMLECFSLYLFFSMQGQISLFNSAWVIFEFVLTVFLI